MCKLGTNTVKFLSIYLNENAIFRSSGILAFQNGHLLKNRLRIDEAVMKNVANYNVTIYNEQSGGYLCVCVSVCEKRGMHNAECHFDFFSHLSSELLADCTVGFKTVAGILLNFMKNIFKMADRQIAKFYHFVNMTDIENIKIFLDSCGPRLSEKVDFLKIAP